MTVRRSVLDELLSLTGSTRGLALFRIGLGTLTLMQFSASFALYGSSPDKGAWGLLVQACALAAILGWRARAATFATGLAVLGAYYYVGLVLGDSRYVIGRQNVYLQAWMSLLLSLTPCGRSYSVDRWLALRKDASAAPPERGELWALHLLKIQVCAVYLWAAFEKLKAGYWSGDALIGTVMSLYFGSDYPPFPGMTGLLQAASVLTLALEPALAAGLLFARTRAAAIRIGVLFHLSLAVFLPVGAFTMLMCLSFLLFLDQDRLHADIDALQRPS